MEVRSYSENFSCKELTQFNGQGDKLLERNNHCLMRLKITEGI